MWNDPQSKVHPRMPSGGNEEACTEDVQNKEIQMQMILSGKSFLFSFFVKETRDLTTFFKVAPLLFRY